MSISKVARSTIVEGNYWKAVSHWWTSTTCDMMVGYVGWVWGRMHDWLWSPAPSLSGRGRHVGRELLDGIGLLLNGCGWIVRAMRKYAIAEVVSALLRVILEEIGGI